MADTKPPSTPKGLYLGRCNRTACQRPDASWYNRGMGGRWADPRGAADCYYCVDCAYEINRWAEGEPLCFPPSDPRHPWHTVSPPTGEAI